MICQKVCLTLAAQLKTYALLSAAHQPNEHGVIYPAVPEAIAITSSLKPGY